MKVLLIRHAESLSNVGATTSDPADISLTRKGLTQSQDLSAAFFEKPSLIVTSKYIRTKQTAQPTMKRFNDVRCEEWDVHEFTYLSPEKCKNTTPDQRRPMVENYWELADPLYCDGDGAETFYDFVMRAQKILSDLKKRDEKLIAMFSHGQFIAGLLWLKENNVKTVDSKSMKEFRSFHGKHSLDNAARVEVLFRMK